MAFVDLSKRKTLQTLAVAASAAIIHAPMVEAAGREKPNLYELLARPIMNEKGKPVQRIFRAHDGKEFNGEMLNVEALRKAQGSKFATLSFSFTGCGNAFCPWTNQKLASLGDNANLVHYVVNLAPELEGGFTPKNPKGDARAQDAFLSRLRDGFGIKGKIVVLYPSSTEAAQQLQADSGMIAIVDGNPQSHASQIMLYGPDGKHIDQRNGAAESLNGWVDIIQGKKIGR